MHSKKEIEAILLKINEGTASLEEKERFQQWYNSFDDSHTAVASDSSAAILKEQIWAGLQKRKSVRTRRWKRYVAVAAVLLLSGTALLVYKQQSSSGASDQDFLRSGLQIEGANAQVESVEGSLSNFLDTAYYFDLQTVSGHTAINAVFTEKGQFSKIILPDGTKVSLNADTKIKLSPDFATAAQRTVELEGEAYFEVTSLPSRSFVVKSKSQEVRVLGTKFNVKAYPNQAGIKTSLFEGKIELVDGETKTLLAPRQQALNEAGIISVAANEAASSAGWRALSFEFDKERIDDVLVQLARWYKLELVLESTVPAQKISGKISRGTSLKDLQTILTNLTQGAYRLADDTLYVKFKNN